MLLARLVAAGQGMEGGLKLPVLRGSVLEGLLHELQKGWVR